MNKRYNPAQEGIDAAREDARKRLKAARQYPNKNGSAFRTPPTAQELVDAAATLSKLTDFFEVWEPQVGQLLLVIKILDNACCDLIPDEES